MPVTRPILSRGVRTGPIAPGTSRAKTSGASLLWMDLSYNLSSSSTIQEDNAKLHSHSWPHHSKFCSSRTTRSRHHGQTNHRRTCPPTDRGMGRLVSLMAYLRRCSGGTWCWIFPSLLVSLSSILQNYCWVWNKE